MQQPEVLGGGDVPGAAPSGSQELFVLHAHRRTHVRLAYALYPVRLSAEGDDRDASGMVQAGYVRHIGLSEVGAQTIRRAAQVQPISDVQIEYSLVSRGIEDAILPTVRELGIGVTAYGVLSRGLLSGHWHPDRELTAGDFRSAAPRFQGENLQRNLELVEALRQIAGRKGVTVAQIAIAWVLSRGEDIVPLVGARRRERLQEALGAVDVELSAEDVAGIEAAVPADAVAGTRYPQPAMTELDSER